MAFDLMKGPSNTREPTRMEEEMVMADKIIALG